jgi:DNA-binding transcriptional regulator YdaS (Cro superfamily)
MEPTQPNEALTRAIARYPSLKAFAGAMDVRYQTVQQWLANGVPAEYCPRIEEMTDGDSRCEDLNGKVNWEYLRATQKPIPPKARHRKASPATG